MDDSSDKRGWRRGPQIGAAGSGSILRSADHALQRFRAIGIPIPSPCRLESAREIVERFHRDPTDQPDRLLLGEATRTIFEFYYIARASGGESGVADRRLRDTLGNALSGPLDPREEDDETARPRNTQLELFVGAWLTSGGAPIRQGEPDLLLQMEDTWHGIAVKRVRSRRKLITRVREAAEQVKRRTGTGMVAIGVDAFVEDVPTGLEPPEAGRSFMEAIPELMSAHDLLMSQPHIRGFIVLGARYEWSNAEGEERPRLAMNTFTQFRLFANSDDEKRRGDAWLEEFDRVQRDRMTRF